MKELSIEDLKGRLPETVIDTEIGKSGKPKRLSMIVNPLTKSIIFRTTRRYMTHKDFIEEDFINIEDAIDLYNEL